MNRDSGTIWYAIFLTFAAVLLVVAGFVGGSNLWYGGILFGIGAATVLALFNYQRSQGVIFLVLVFFAASLPGTLLPFLLFSHVGFLEHAQTNFVLAGYGFFVLIPVAMMSFVWLPGTWLKWLFLSYGVLSSTLFFLGAIGFVLMSFSRI